VGPDPSSSGVQIVNAEPPRLSRRDSRSSHDRPAFAPGLSRRNTIDDRSASPRDRDYDRGRRRDDDRDYDRGRGRDHDRDYDRDDEHRSRSKYRR
jgi:splicing factor U2AF 65 kDa subunit